MTGNALAVEQLSKHYRAGTREEVRALQDISLAIPPGSFVALVGPSGSGKTTLLSLLGGLDRPTAGSVRFGGRELAACSDVELARLRRRMGFVFQGLSLVSGLPAWENVTYPLVPRAVSSRERLRLAADVLTRLDLADKVQTPPEELSGGEQQRVAVARALVGTPEVIFADEPTSNLDRASAGELAGLLSEIHAEGTTLVISTHDADLIQSASLVFTLEEGRLVDVTDQEA